MTTTSIRFKNFNDNPIYIQVDPVAGLYVLKKGELIEIIAKSETTSASFDIIEDGSTRYLMICDSLEYDVVLDGQRMNCFECLTNLQLGE